MIRIADIDGQRLNFPDGWDVATYDKLRFYKNHFQSFAGGVKGLDVVAISPDKVCWLIEVKDYRQHKRTKLGTVFAETAAKILATLAGLAAARVRSYDSIEKSFADKALKTKSFRVVLCIDQPQHNSRLFQQIINPQTAHIKLQQAVRVIDPHARCSGAGVADIALPWTTTRPNQLQQAPA